MNRTASRLSQKMLAAALLLTPAPLSAAVIGVDAVHMFEPQDNLATGIWFEGFQEAIRSLGHEIRPLLSFEADDLLGIDALIAIVPTWPIDEPDSPRLYSPQEMSAIRGFVNRRAVFIGDTNVWADPEFSDRPITFGDNLRLLENSINFVLKGGGGIFLGDDGSNTDIWNFNELVAPYGIRFGPLTVGSDGETLKARDILPHEVTEGVASFGVDYYITLHANAPSQELTVGSDWKHVLAVYEVAEPTGACLIGLAALCLSVHQRSRNSGARRIQS